MALTNIVQTNTMLDVSNTDLGLMESCRLNTAATADKEINTVAQDAHPASHSAAVKETTAISNSSSTVLQVVTFP